MTNREKLLNTNIYDLLVLLNANMIECILDVIENNEVPCPLKESGQRVKCSDCIQKYLNKEV